MNQKIDNVDRSILKMLQSNGTVSNRVIGNILHKSASTIYGRRTRLENDGFIIRTSARVNPKLVGYNVQGCIYMRMTAQSSVALQNLKDHLLKITGVCEAKLITGSYGIRLNLVAEDTGSFNDIRKTIGDLPGVALGTNYVELDDLISYRGLYL